MSLIYFPASIACCTPFSVSPYPLHPVDSDIVFMHKMSTQNNKYRIQDPWSISFEHLLVTLRVGLQCNNALQHSFPVRTLRFCKKLDWNQNNQHIFNTQTFDSCPRHTTHHVEWHFYGTMWVRYWITLEWESSLALKRRPCYFWGWIMLANLHCLTCWRPEKYVLQDFCTKSTCFQLTIWSDAK